MKVLAVTILALVAVVSGRNIDIGDVIDLETITAYGYLEKIGKPLAEEIRQAEEAGQSTRIVGGTAARLGEFPHQAGLIVNFPGGQGVCGASLVSVWRALTAAHCWNDGRTQGNSVTVVLGSIVLFSGGQRITTNSVVMHGSWWPALVRNDIAMIRLSVAASLNNNVAPIALPSGNQLNMDFAGTSAVASGFGATQDSGGASNTMNRVSLTVISNAECTRTFPLLITAGNICTSGAGGRSTCRGDSGGPLSSWLNQDVLIGITSFGHSDGCQRGHPAAFVRITAYNSWILSQM